MPPDQPRKPKPTWTPARQFRLSDEDLAFIDLVVDHIQREMGGSPSRAEGIRRAVRYFAEQHGYSAKKARRKPSE